MLAAQSADPIDRSRAIESIAAAYWKPVYKYTRMKRQISPDDAADFTQEFFTRLLEKDFLDGYDSSKGRLRTFLRTCADRLFLNQMRDANRIKRGAGLSHLSLDFTEAENELASIAASTAASESPEDLFDKEWVRSLFSLGLQKLRANCAADGKAIHLHIFERYDLADEDTVPSYAQLATEFNLSATDVTNYLAFARREFRRCVLEQLRDMTASDEEFRCEAQALLGVDAP